ncbi:MAG TPA: HdeD family acid-resistance protein [Streptosporangiaceae bacterium]|nr:HdeD family acid-resistance protein [Streptosporangiaceae bacterium]
MSSNRSAGGSGNWPGNETTAPGQPAGQATGQTAGPSAPMPGRRAGAGDLSRLASAAWPAFLAAGIGSVIVGVILLAWPKETLTIVAILIGVALIVAGFLRLIDGFTSHEASGGKRVASVVVGLIAIILGLWCIRHYHFTIAALAIIVGLFWVIHGISDIAAGLFAGRFPGRGITVLSGFLSLAAGLIVLFWPTISLTVLVAVIGIWLIVYGLLAGYLAFRLRRSGPGAIGSGPGQVAAV